MGDQLALFPEPERPSPQRTPLPPRENPWGTLDDTCYDPPLAGWGSSELPTLGMIEHERAWFAWLLAQQPHKPAQG